MFKNMLAVQWRFSRNILIAFGVMTAIVPALTMRVFVASTINNTPRGLVEFATVLGSCLAVLAVLAGLFLYANSWHNDTVGKNVYLLSLPITWRQFMLRRLAGGLILLLVPAVCLWIGGMIATAFVPLPEHLHAYALGVAFRFFLASSLVYCLWSALVQFSGQKATVVLLVLLLVGITIPTLIAMTGMSFPGDTLLRWVADPPSPLSVFFSRWALIDV